MQPTGAFKEHRLKGGGSVGVAKTLKKLAILTVSACFRKVAFDISDAHFQKSLKYDWSRGTNWRVKLLLVFLHAPIGKIP